LEREGGKLGSQREGERLDGGEMERGRKREKDKAVFSVEYVEEK